MTTQITHVSIFQTAKVISVVYGIFGILYIPLGWIIDSASPAEEQLGAFWLWMPFVLLVLTFVATAAGCAIYNFVASRVGGIELTLGSDDSHA